MSGGRRRQQAQLKSCYVCTISLTFQSLASELDLSPVYLLMWVFSQPFIRLQKIMVYKGLWSPKRHLGERRTLV